MLWVLILGTPKKVPLVLGNPHIAASGYWVTGLGSRDIRDSRDARDHWGMMAVLIWRNCGVLGGFRV